MEHDSDQEMFRPVCQRVTGYCLVERYPLPGVSAPPEEEVRFALESAQELVARIRDALMG